MARPPIPAFEPFPGQAVSVLIAGQAGGAGADVDGAALSAVFNTIVGVAVAPDEDTMYVLEGAWTPFTAPGANLLETAWVQDISYRKGRGYSAPTLPADGLHSLPHTKAGDCLLFLACESGPPEAT